MLTAVVLRGMKESENLPLYSASRQELQQQQYQAATGRPVPFPTTTKAAQSSAALAAGIMKMTQSQQSMGLTISKVTVPKANIVNVGRAAAAAQPKGVAGLSGVTITPIGASTAGSSETTAAKEGVVSNKRKRTYVPKRVAQVPLVEVGGPRLPKLPRIPKITDKDIRLPSPASLGLPSTMPFGPPGLLPG